MSDVKRYVEGLTGMTERATPRYEGDLVYVLASDYDAKCREVERLRADADRYRRLRDEGVPECCIALDGLPSYTDDSPPAEIDAAIDAALAAKGET